MTSAPHDVAIVGGGPNGLTAAAYLARAGASVIVFEQRFERGGTLASDDYSTPFLYNQAQLALPLVHELPPFRDLGLDERPRSRPGCGTCRRQGPRRSRSNQDNRLAASAPWPRRPRGRCRLQRRTTAPA